MKRVLGDVSNRKAKSTRAGLTKGAAALVLIVLVSIIAYQYLMPAPHPPTSITIGIADATNGYWPVYIAEDSRIFERYGLNPTIVFLGGGKGVVSSLVAGQV